MMQHVNAHEEAQLLWMELAKFACTAGENIKTSDASSLQSFNGHSFAAEAWTIIENVRVTVKNHWTGIG